LKGIEMAEVTNITYNTDIDGLVRRINRFITEIFLAQSSGLSKTAAFDVARMQSYTKAIRQYVAWVVQMPLLDLPETGPREIAALSRRFNEMTKQVEELLAARTVLLAGVSHDLRTPLARLRLAVEMLVRKPSPQLAAQVEGDIEAMDRLIGDVLTLARGLGHEAVQRVVLSEFCKKLVLSIPGAADKVQVEIADVTLDVPPGALRRILVNLLENALRYGGDQPVSLRAEVEDGRCRIGVLDRGPGIPPDELETVYRPFYRLEASRSVNTGGSGLGLAIVRQLAMAQGWQARLQAREGGGLAAWLEIPLQQADKGG
jgi:two-component system osmolarity sensor histidine kinase EnvZ